jgi:hypothetical protein
MSPIPVVPFVRREIIDCTSEEVWPSDGVEGEDQMVSQADLKPARARAEFAGAEAHVVSPEELGTDCFCAFVLSFTETDCGFEFGVCAVFKADERGVDLTCCDSA